MEDVKLSSPGENRVNELSSAFEKYQISSSALKLTPLIPRRGKKKISTPSPEIENLS